MPSIRQGIVSVLVTSSQPRLETEEVVRQSLELMRSYLERHGVHVESVRGEHSLSMVTGGSVVVPMPSLPGD